MGNICLIITFIHGACFLFSINNSDYKNVIIRTCIAFNLIIMLANIVNVISLSFFASTNITVDINFIISTIQIIISGVCGLLFYAYINIRLNEKFDNKMFILTISIILFSLLNYYNNLLFTIDNNIYKRMELYYLFIAFMAIYGLKIIFVVVKNRKILLRNELRVIIFIIISYYFALFYNIWGYNNIDIWTVFSVFLCIYNVYISRHRGMYDYITGAVQISTINNYIENPNEQFFILTFEIEDYERIEKNYGNSVAENVIQVIAICLKEFNFDKNKFIKISNNKLALLFYENEKDLIKEVQNDFQISISRINQHQEFPFEIKVGLKVKNIKINELVTN